MLTIKQNFLETIHGGQPDRFVNQYEYMETIPDPILMNCGGICALHETKVNDWGVTITWPDNVPGPFPVHTPDKILLKDVTQWESVLKAPDPAAYPEEMWAPYEAMAASADRNEKFVACIGAPGIFEKLHYFMGMDNALMNLIAEPEAMHEIIDFLVDWEIACAKVQISHFHPNALFHHDDWGSQTRTFFSPAMFEEFLVPAYRKVYGFWKANGVQIIVHHSDSYAATLVPAMIEIGIDVFQGAVRENDIPAILRQYGGKISVQGGMDNGKFDTADWSREKLRRGLRELVEACGTRHLIPSITQGGPGSAFPGVYEALTEEIQALSSEYF